MMALQDADLSLVEIQEGTPHCKIHGAMNRLTKNGIWRCVSSYIRIENGTPQGRIIENSCKAGCVYP